MPTMVCKICGAQISDQPPGPTGWSPKYDLCEACEQVEKEKQRKALELARRNKNLRFYETKAREAGLPAIYHEVSFKTYEIDNGNKAAVDAAWDLIKHGGFLTLYGDTGAGKTTLAACIIREWILQDFICRFISESDFLHLTRHEVSDRVSADRLYWIHNTTRLVFDDLGSASTSSSNMSRVMSLADKRLTKGLVTVWTTNMTGSQISGKFGSRVASRLIGGGPLIKVSGRDRRRG